jgi:hypothetical protein
MCVTAQERRALPRLFGLLAEDIGGHAPSQSLSENIKRDYKVFGA